MNDLSMSIFRDFVSAYDLAKGKVVVDVGSYDYNGTYRPLFPDSKYIGTDIEVGPNVDMLIGSDEWKSLKDVDAVISGNTFEHVEDDEALLDQINAIMKPGGMLCVSAPSTGPVHHARNWYRYYTKERMESIISNAGFEVIECVVDPHPEFMFVTCIARKDGVGRKGKRSGGKKDEGMEVRISVSEKLSADSKLR